MQRLWRAAFAVGGIAAIGAFVFWSLYRQWLALPIFERLDRRQTFVVMLAFLGLTFVALIAAFLLHARQGKPADDVLSLYERLRDGLGSPNENAAQIERIANSTDPRRASYLRELASNPDISFFEVAAVNFALEDLADRKRVAQLKERAQGKELPTIEAAVKPFPEPLRTVLLGCKYWRYTTRKSHPLFDKMNEFIAIVITQGMTDRARELSLELQGEFAKVL